jgi:hypothetical protein
MTDSAANRGEASPANGSAGPLAEAELDLSDDQSEESATISPQLGGDYDPRPLEDAARRIIAYLLIGILFFVVVAIVGLVSFQVIKVDEIKEFAVVLGPIVTLVSAATGFYYGTKVK